jgi:hypothetical protein
MNPSLPYLRARSNGSILHIPVDTTATGWQAALCGTQGREPDAYRRLDRVCKQCSNRLLAATAP